MIEYVDSVERVNAAMLNGFFFGWKRPHSPEDHLRILKNSDAVVLAIETENGRVVGFVTALTDRLQAAFIPLLEVLPEYQNQGIGSQLMSRILDKLKDTPAIDLTCDKELQPFYSRLGMQPSVGMVIRNY